MFLALRSEGSSLSQSLLLISKLCRYIFTFTSQGNRFSFELYLTIILIISPQVPFPPKGNFCCKSAKVIYHRPAFSLGLSTHIDFATWLSNYLHKSANSLTNNVTNRSKKYLGLQRKWCAFISQKLYDVYQPPKSIFASPCPELLGKTRTLPSLSL